MQGYCCVVYEVCQDFESSFAISDISMSATDDDCLDDYVLIEGRASWSWTHGRYEN